MLTYINFLRRDFLFDLGFVLYQIMNTWVLIDSIKYITANCFLLYIILHIGRSFTNEITMVAQRETRSSGGTIVQGTIVRIQRYLFVLKYIKSIEHNSKIDNICKKIFVQINISIQYKLLTTAASMHFRITSRFSENTFLLVFSRTYFFYLPQLLF